MLHEDEIRLRHMLDHAREAVAMIAGKERADLQQERMLELALVRLVEIIGEAAARVDPDVQGGHPYGISGNMVSYSRKPRLSSMIRLRLQLPILIIRMRKSDILISDSP